MSGRAGRFTPGLLRPEDAGEGRWFVVRDGRLVVRDDGEATGPLSGPSAEALGLRADRHLHLGSVDGVAVDAIEIAADADLPAGTAAYGLRDLWGRLDDEAWTLAGRAVQLLAWDRDHVFCSRCATPTATETIDRSRRCPACGLSSYPRLAPAVIMLITDDEGRALLAQGSRFPQPFFSCLAGFVEPGETLEECVEREVHEETGIDVDEIRYVSSQPWPFPHSLMIGFEAHYAGGGLSIDPEEIVAAGWYRPDDLPLIPPRPSIARALIDGWVARVAGAG